MSKKITTSKAKEKAWKQCSLFVRLRDADWKGDCRCCTCGKIYHFRKMQAGHFNPGRHNSILYDTRGIHAQCFRCNINLKGNPRAYNAFMLKKYGQEVIDELDNLERQTKQMGADDHLKIEEYFKEEISKLDNASLIT